MENPQKPVASDEIDLGVLFTKIGDFFKRIGFGFIRFLALLRNTPLTNRTLFVSVILLGAIIGYSYSSFLKKKFYESTMILSSSYLNMRIVDSSIDKLNLLAEEETPSGLARELQISDSLAENIVKFEAKPFVAESDLIELEVLKEQLRNSLENNKNEKVIEQVISRIEIENRHAFEFTVRTYNPTVIKPLQEALVNYFRNNEYIKKRIEINKTTTTEKKEKLERELPKLDSLKRVIYANYKNMSEQNRQGSNNVILSDQAITNPIEIYNRDLTLFDEILSAQRQLFLQPDFEVIDGFTEFSEPSSASTAKIIVIAMAIGFVLSYLIVGFRNFDKYLATVK